MNNPHLNADDIQKIETYLREKEYSEEKISRILSMPQTVKLMKKVLDDLDEDLKKIDDELELKKASRRK